MRIREKAVWAGELIVIKLSAVRRAVQVVGVKRVGVAQRLIVDAIHGGGEASAGAARKSICLLSLRYLGCGCDGD